MIDRSSCQKQYERVGASIHRLVVAGGWDTNRVHHPILRNSGLCSTDTVILATQLGSRGIEFRTCENSQ
jgi:hypothetical protein